MDLIKTCRTCVQIIKKPDDYSVLNKMETEILQIIVPNFNTEAVSEPIICKVCHNSLQLISNFRKMCLENETKITSYIHNLNPPRKLLHSQLSEAIKNKNSDTQTQQKPTKTETTTTDSKSSIKHEIEIVEHDINDDNAIRNIQLPRVPCRPCPLCDQTFKSKVKLREHLDAHEGLVCKVCEAKCDGKRALDTHMAGHGEKPFRCETCQKRFKIKRTFDKHREMHKGELKFKCGVCKLRFPTTGQLLKHAFKKKCERPFYSLDGGA